MYNIQCALLSIIIIINIYAVVVVAVVVVRRLFGPGQNRDIAPNEVPYVYNLECHDIVQI